mgnify:CR=1 FL=1
MTEQKYDGLAEAAIFDDSDLRYIGKMLDEMDAGDRKSVLALLSCVRDHPGNYLLQRRKGGSTKRPYEYAVLFPDAERREPCDPQTFTWDFIGNRWEIARPTDANWDSYTFSAMLLAWFRRNHPPSDLQVQRWIVQELFESYLENAEANPRKSYINPESFAERFGVSLRTFSRQATTLRAKGIVQINGIVGLRFEDGFFRLTDSGREWAANGYRDTQSEFTPRVEVNVHLETFVQVVTEVAVADVDQETKDEFLTAMQDVEKDPTIERLGRVMEIAANTKELLPPLIKFLAESPAWLTTHFLK